jgi:two-component system alkaline phosphatase synthesis response regulator PhoP
LGYSFGDVEVNFRRAEVKVKGIPIELSAKEYQLLKYFIEHRDTVISRYELLDQVWGYEALPSTRTVDVHISWLRQKLEPNQAHPQYFLTVHGLGYKFVG